MLFLQMRNKGKTVETIGNENTTKFTVHANTI